MKVTFSSTAAVAAALVLASLACRASASELGVCECRCCVRCTEPPLSGTFRDDTCTRCNDRGCASHVDACSTVGPYGIMVLTHCDALYMWGVSAWSPCGPECNRTRSVECVATSNSSVVPDKRCAPLGQKPAAVEQCAGDQCAGSGYCSCACQKAGALKSERRYHDGHCDTCSADACAQRFPDTCSTKGGEISSKCSWSENRHSGMPGWAAALLAIVLLACVAAGVCAGVFLYKRWRARSPYDSLMH
eukprot:m51a1_g1368 putative C-tail anchored protein (247) ;mRNA; f:411833-412573